MRLLITIVGLVLVAIPALARAECPTKYQLPNMAKDLGTMQSALRSLDEEAFRGAGERLSAGLQCMATPAPSAVHATAYRLLGAYHHLAGDEQIARSWFRAALELDPAFSWDVRDFDVGHPIRIAFEEESAALDSNLAEVPDKLLSVPAGSELLMDGRPLTAAAATLERPHLIQQVGSDKAVRNTWLIQGNEFPAVLLQVAGETNAQATLVIDEKPSKERKSREKKKKDEEAEEVVVQENAGTGDVVVVDRARPPMKTPLLILSGVGVAAAGGTYVASYMTRKKFDAATTSAEVDQLRTTTNTLVLASGGVALVALGIGYWGVLLDGGVGFGFVKQF